MKLVVRITTVLTIVILLTFAAEAAPITFQLTSATIGGINDSPAQANGEWIYLDGYRIKLAANGMPGVGEELGIFWAAQIGSGEPTREFTISLKGSFCSNGACAEIETGGVITTSALGMAWKLPPPAWTVELSNGKLLVVTPRTNQPRPGNTQGTIDLDITGELVGAEVPEPMTLVGVGTGMLMLARFMRRKREEITA